MEKEAFTRCILNKPKAALAIIKYNLAGMLSLRRTRANSHLLHSLTSGQLFFSSMESLLRLWIGLIIALLSYVDSFSIGLAGFTKVSQCFMCEAQIIMTILISRFLLDRFEKTPDRLLIVLLFEIQNTQVP